MSGLNVSKLGSGTVTVVGMFSNAYLMSLINPYLPNALKSGIGGYAARLVTAGGAGILTSLVSPKHAGPIAWGGVLETLRAAFGEYLMPTVTSVLPGPKAAVSTAKGFGDYLSVQNAQQARSLGDYSLGDDFDDNMSGMGDYLSVQNAKQARSLGGFGDGEDTIAEELAGM